jgi:hypothetical protein
MKTDYRRIPAGFGPEVRFELLPTVGTPFRAVVQNRFEQLQKRLLAQRLQDIWEPGLNSQIRRAANEAAALAWVTPFPLLVFPSLFEEKADTALAQAERQTQVLQRSPQLVVVA